MDSNFDKHRNRRRGFTLVEVIVVLVVLAILAAILIPSMNKWIDEANKRKVTVACRTCVTAAATIAAERYATSEEKALLTPPSDEEIRDLAGVDTGSVVLVTVTQPAGRRIGSNTYTKETYPPGTVEYLTYTDGKDNYATYVLAAGDGYDSSHIILSNPTVWSKGVRFTKGEIMVFGMEQSNGEMLNCYFRCLASHKTGSRSNTRNPTVKSNKGSWELIGTETGEPPDYSPTVRYGISYIVKYNGNLYSRTDFNLTGGQTPYSKSSSVYWTLIGPAPTAP